MDVIRLKLHQYIHVLDNNLNVTRCVEGPCVYTRQSHEEISQTFNAVAIPPRCYVRIRNPCMRDGDGKPAFDAHGQVMLRYGDEAILFAQDPFPLMPGEVLVDADTDEGIKKLQVVERDSALHLVCERDFTDEATGAEFKAGNQWLFRGPATYIPRVEVRILKEVRASIIRPNTALHMRCKQAYTAADGTQRHVGEEWMVTEEGAFLPRVEETVVKLVEAIELSDVVAVHLEAVKQFIDARGKVRQPGEQWLLTSDQGGHHICHVSERVLQKVNAIILSKREYCVVLDPFDAQSGTNAVGQKVIRRGEASFFLHPGERLRKGIEQITVLGNDEALLLQASEGFDDNGTRREPRQKWMVYGPCEYITPVQVEVLERRKRIPLDKNEGVYVHDEKTGIVRAVIGEAYMLNANETLWKKEVPAVVEELLATTSGCKNMLHDKDAFKSSRDPTRVVRFNVAHNAAVQLYDYKKKVARIVLGPNVVMLQPDEQFTVLAISGEKPKIPNVIKSLPLLLGPEFSSDHVIVETADHARLRLMLSYNWHFDVNPQASQEELSKLFYAPDFVGDMCKCIASRVRGAVATQSFADFHRQSARIIRTAVFGTDDEGRVKNSFRFNSNNLVVTNVDIKSVEPTDTKTRDSLQKSVQMAIEITTQSQEAAARQDNARKDQEAKGKLERQKLGDNVEAEKAKKNYLELRAMSDAIESCGQAIAEAKSAAESAIIEAESEAELAKFQVEAFNIAAGGELRKIVEQQTTELEYKRRINAIELRKAQKLSQIETEKLARVMKAIGPETIVAIAAAGPEMQAKLLEGLGLKGYLITDGNSPINLFNTANGMVGPQSGIGM